MNQIANAVTQIVSAQASVRTMTAEEIAETIQTVASAMSQLLEGETVENDLGQLRRNPDASILKDKIICLECGHQFKLLGNRHMRLHKMTPTEYKAKWGIQKGTALSSFELTRKRRRGAKKNNSGGALEKWRRDNGISKSPAKPIPMARKKRAAK